MLRLHVSHVACCTIVHYILHLLHVVQFTNITNSKDFTVYSENTIFTKCNYCFGIESLNLGD